MSSNFVVCGACGTQFAVTPEPRCPGCGRTVELPVPPPRRWPDPPRAQRQAASALLLANAVLLGAHVLLLRDSATSVLVAALLDLLLVGLVWLRPGVWLALGHAGVGVLLAFLFLRSGQFPLLPISQGVWGLALLPLLAPRLRGAGWIAAAPGPLLYTGLGLGMIFSLATASEPLTHALTRLRGHLAPEPVTRLEGRAERYTMSLPAGPWHPYTAEQLDKAQLDAALLNPALGVELVVIARRLPGLGWVGMDTLEAMVRQMVAEQRPGLSWGESRELPGPWDEGRLVYLRGRTGGLVREAVLAIYIWGDRLFLLEASCPSWRFQDRLPLLEQLVGAFHFEPPPRPFLSQDVAQRVTRATVMVRTSYGSGSGFLVRNEKDYYVLTNHHVVSTQEGDAVVREAGILFPGDKRGERTATVLSSDAARDMALLKLPVMGAPVAALALRAAPPPKDTPVVSIGYPLGEQFRLGSIHPRPTLNSGTVLDPSAAPPPIYKDQAARLLLTDLGINPGNSGGPVVDLEGAVVGMVVAAAPASESSFVIPVSSLLPFAGQDIVRQVDGPSPQAPSGPETRARFPESARAALRAATVFVHLGSFQQPGVLLDIPGPGAGLVLTVAGRLTLGSTVDVDFFPPAAAKPLTRHGTVRALEKHKEVELALVQVEDFPERPRGLPLQDGERVRETDPLVLGGFRDTSDGRTLTLHEGVLSGIERTERWEYGAQLPAWLRVDMGAGRAFHPGAAVDREGALVGFVTERTQRTNITELVASERLREMIAGRVQAVAARATRDPDGGCQVEFFVDAQGPVSPKRTVSFASDTPSLPLADDALAPSFGPARELGVLERADSVFPVSLSPCPAQRLVYRLTLTSALGVQSVEGLLPLPSRAGERTQARVPVPRADGRSHWALDDFLAWKGVAPRVPDTEEARLLACAAAGTCGFHPTSEQLADARARMHQVTQVACRQGRPLACLHWAADVDATAPEAASPNKPLEKDLSRGALFKGCDERGESEMCSQLGWLLLQPGKQEDWRKAEYLLRKGCVRGSPAGCVGLEGALAVGSAPLSRKYLLPEAREALTRGCDAGLAEACARLGRRLMDQAEDWTGAVQALRKGCEGGDARGCSGLAGALAVGHGVALDETQALHTYRQACRLHDAVACLSAGFLHQGLRPAGGDRDRAYEVFHRACALGQPRGCREMIRALDLVEELRDFNR